MPNEPSPMRFSSWYRAKPSNSASTLLSSSGTFIRSRSLYFCALEHHIYAHVAVSHHPEPGLRVGARPHSRPARTGWSSIGARCVGLRLAPGDRPRAERGPYGDHGTWRAGPYLPSLLVTRTRDILVAEMWIWLRGDTTPLRDWRSHGSRNRSVHNLAQATRMEVCADGAISIALAGV
jgi:hypothetical protein